MSLLNVLRRLLRSTENSQSTMTVGTVREELMFHFRELISQKVSEGQSLDSAWEQAERQFGSVQHYENECEATQLERRLTRRIAGTVVCPCDFENVA